MNIWITPCNIKKYDVFGAFEKFKRLNWKQSTNIQVGDIVYIYTGIPHSRITHKCKAVEVDLQNSYIGDNYFVINPTPYKNFGRYMTLELISPIEGVDGKWLKERGVMGNIQGPRKIDFEI